MPTCGAFGCNNRTASKTHHQLYTETLKKITFHRFPKEHERRKAWVKAVGRKGWMPSVMSVLCSLHFTEECFDRTSLSCVRLREGVIPSIFNFHKECTNIVPPHVKHWDTSKANNETAEVQKMASQADSEPSISDTVMPRCAAVFCRNTSRKTENVTYHKFPLRQPKLLQQWVRNMRRVAWTPSKHSFLCSEHFRKSCLDRTGQTVRLRPGSVPSIFNHHQTVKTEETAADEPVKSARADIVDQLQRHRIVQQVPSVRAVCISPSEDESGNPSQQDGHTACASEPLREHGVSCVQETCATPSEDGSNFTSRSDSRCFRLEYNYYTTSETLKRKLNVALEKNKLLVKKLKLSHQTIRRLNKKVESLSEEVDVLRYEYLHGDTYQLAGKGLSRDFVGSTIQQIL